MSDIMKLMREREREREQAAQAELKRHLERFPTGEPHRLWLVIDGGVSPRIECPGKEHCGLWYGRYWPEGSEQHKAGERGRCGLELWCSEVGSEFLEWMIGPDIKPETMPILIGFTWENMGDDPPEVAWWPLPQDDSSENGAT